MQKLCLLLAAVLAFTLASFANIQIVPTTTLIAETGNNTSTANGFASQSNGNRGASNISKSDVHSLLYTGATTRIYAHLMLWFGGTNHMDVGYNSADPGQIKRQIDDMISRGIDGVIIDWYGQGSLSDQATLVLKTEAEAHPGFSFAIMIDKGAILSNSCDGCSPQQALVAHLQYVERTYFGSPAYMKIDGRPVVTNFDIDLYYSIDWIALADSVTSNPQFLFQNNDGFSHAVSGGSYSWVMPTQTDYGMNYLQSFYSTGKGFAQEETAGAAYKGFNDTLAGWGKNRIMSQQCGQTWLQTFAKINSLYNSGTPLDSLQLVTWNDYEEGTELESGIDNCLNVAASLSGRSFQWSVTGNENTVDHYVVYISTDGQDLMPLNEPVAGTRALDLCGYSLDVRSYTLYLQAIGKPSMANHMSAPVSYTPNCDAGKGLSISLDAAPSTLTLAGGQSGSSNISVLARSGSFEQAVVLSCSGLPAGLTCAFNPAVIPAGGKAAISVLTVSAMTVASRGNVPGPERRQVPWLGGLLAFGVMGITLSGRASRRLIGRTLLIALLFGMTLLFNACGGVGSSSAATGLSRGDYSIVITGHCGPVEGSTAATVLIR